MRRKREREDALRCQRCNRIHRYSQRKMIPVSSDDKALSSACPKCGCPSYTVEGEWTPKRKR